MPTNAYLAFRDTIIDIIKNKNGNLLFFWFPVNHIFCYHGVTKPDEAFNKSSLLTDRRSWLKRRGVALSLYYCYQFCSCCGYRRPGGGQGAISFIKHHLASKSTSGFIPYFSFAG